MINTSSNIGTYRKKVNELEENINNVSESLENSTASLSSSINTIDNACKQTYLPKNAKDNTIIQQQWSTSNYTTIVNWVSDNITYLKNKPQIGHHNSGIGGNTGIGTGESGAIVLLPYSTDANPWERGVGLYIGKNALTLDGNEVRFVKATYVSGTTWYRVWSDGWIEQGGKYTGASGTCWSTTITFPKAFSNTNYNISVTSTGLAGDMWGEHGENVESITTSSFKYYFYTGASGDGTTGFYWTACGY